MLSITIAILVTGGVYLVLQRGMMRIVLGMSLISHAANLIILATGIPSRRGEIFAGRTPSADMADPLPQAFVLTAIVITMATATFMLALAALGKDDDTTSSADPEAATTWNTAGRKAQRTSSERRSTRVHQRYARHVAHAEEHE